MSNTTINLEAACQNKILNSETRQQLIKELIEKALFKTEDTKTKVIFERPWRPIEVTIRNASLNISMKISWELKTKESVDFILVDREEADERWRTNHYDQNYKRAFLTQSELNERIDMITGYLYRLLLSE